MKRMTYLCRIGRTSLGLPRQAKADMSIKTAQLPTLCLLNQYGIKKLSTVSDNKSKKCLVKSGKDNIAVAGFVYQAEKVGFRQQEIIHGSVNFENYTLFSACAHEYNWQKTRQKIKNPTLNFTKCWISEV